MHTIYRKLEIDVLFIQKELMVDNGRFFRLIISHLVVILSQPLYLRFPRLQYASRIVELLSSHAKLDESYKMATLQHIYSISTEGFSDPLTISPQVLSSDHQ